MFQTTLRLNFDASHSLVSHSLTPFRIAAGLCLAVLTLGACKKDPPAKPKNDSTGSMQALRVEGRWFIDEQGKKTVVRGVNIASLEWTSSGENMTRSLGVAVDDWKANLVRIPLCQDRWFGKTADKQDGGYAYRSIVAELVRLADQRSCYILL